MVDFSLTNALSPMLFSTNGYKVVVMPMVIDKAQKGAKAKAAEQATAYRREVHHNSSARENELLLEYSLAHGRMPLCNESIGQFPTDLQLHKRPFLLAAVR